MITKAPSPHQWMVLQRLAAAGCPVDIAHLIEPNWPLRISIPGENPKLIQLHGRSAIVMALRLTAVLPISVASYRLTADWLNTRIAWAPPCAEHGGKVCIRAQGDNGAHWEFGRPLARYTGVRLKPGNQVDGFLVGTTTPAQIPTAAELNATLWIGDTRQRNYPYALKLRTTAEELSPQDSKFCDGEFQHFLALTSQENL
jgi:hypothetical protein